MPGSDTSSPAPRRSFTDRALGFIERGGNALPHPATLFAILAAAVVVASWLAAHAGLAVVHPATGETVRPVNLLSVEGLHRILGGLVPNFTGFAPLGTVLVALIGTGVAEHSGLIGAALRRLVLAAPRALLTPILVFAGVMSNMASEIGYVLLIPMAGLIFRAAGRHPILGMAAAFAGVSGGYSANLLIGSLDPLLSGLSQEAARIVAPDYSVSAVANWYFMVISTPVITLLGWYVTERIVARRFPGPPTAGGDDGNALDQRLSDAERRGLRWALYATLAFTTLLVWSALPSGTLPGAGFLRNPANDDLLDSPLMTGIVAILFVYGVVVGIAYGVAAGTIKSDEDVLKGMSAAMGTMGSYLVLVFFAAQFVAFFNWSQLGLVLAMKGAAGLQSLGLPAVPLFIAFILLTASVNLFVGSASAKWALMAPVFVPMFMLLGYSPELTQAAYRVGDSVTNIVSPMMSYFALIIAFFQRYEPRAGLGTLVAVMLPYSLAFLAGWTLLFAVWLGLELPIGPDAPLHYPAR
jgi:aminobenzoyl-glutamate transport protein